MLNLNKSSLWTVSLILLFSISLSFNLKAQTYPVSDFDPNLQKVIAFPGAEGFGKFVTGGRGGQVLKVTNLNDSGEGSLRAAIETRGPRIIVFEVSGNIKLKDVLRIRHPDLTIAGQTAPGDGITVQNFPLVVESSSNIIIRYIRSRLGDLAPKEYDAMSILRSSGVIADHCSVSWGTDESFSIKSSVDVTVQNCIISEGLNLSIHPKGEHGFGSLVSGNRISFYQNLWAHFTLRNPYLSGNGPEDIFDLRNNVIYNWGFRPSDGGANAYMNFYNNYYKPGPASYAKGDWTPENFLIGTMSDNDPSTYGKFYLEGNELEGKTLNKEQWLGVRLENTSNTEKYLETLKNKDQSGNLVPIEIPKDLYSEIIPAKTSFQSILNHAGASLKRDVIDVRIIQETKDGKITFKGSKTNLLGIIDSQKDVGGWPALKSSPTPTDSDGDGIPDDWESGNGLDPNIPNDKEFNLSPYYTDIEVYVNSLVQDFINNQNSGVPSKVNPTIPENNETVSPVDISFAWKPLSNAQAYRLQISKNSDFSSNVITINNIKNYSLVFPELEANSTYFWRVRASNASGNGIYSTVRSFKTGNLNTVPGRTILLSPETQKEGVGLSPIFKWAKVPNAVSYRLQVSTSSDFSSLVINQSNISLSEYQSSKLTENRTYYWRVRASNSSGNGSNSIIGVFKTLSLSIIPEAVVPISPLNNVSVSPLQIQLKWRDEPSSEKYHVQISTESSFSNRVYDNRELTNLSIVIPNLESNKTYYWRIRGENRGGIGYYSTVSAFKTQPYTTAPNQVKAISPEDGSNVFSTKIIFQWMEAATAQNYRLQISTSSNFSSIVHNIGNINGTSYSVSNLQPNTQYYWRVIASNEAGNAPASDIRKVRTASYSAPPSSATLISPVNQAVVGVATVLFEWENQPNTEYYRLEISEQFNFNSYTYLKSSIAGTSFKVSGLNSNKTYYWRIRTSNPAGIGERSEIWSFNTVDKDIDLFPPILLNPRKGDNYSNNEISFAWNEVENATAYHLQVSESADFSTISYQNQNITTTNFSLNSLAKDKAYFWRLRASANSIFSSWSEEWGFSIGSNDLLLNSGLIGYWPMEEGGGSKMMDASGNNNHATIQNTSNVFWVNGKAGKAISLNGNTGRYGVIQHNPILNIANAITLSAWVKPKELQRGNIFYKSAGNGFELWLDIDGYIEFRLNRSNNGTTYKMKSNYNYNNSLGKWIHVAATFDGNTSKIFINGKENVVKKYSPFSIGTTSGNLFIGSMGTTQRWNGELDELRLYDRALTSNEILLLSGEELPSQSPPSTALDKLMGHWRMDEGSGNILVDNSGNGNDATIQNTSDISWSKGVNGMALNLSGAKERFAVAPHSSSLEISDALTIVAWIKPNAIGRNTVISKADGNGFELWLDNNGQIEFRLNRGNNGASYKLNSRFDYSGDIGNWIHLAATFDGTTSKIFVNGFEDTSDKYTPFSIKTTSGNLVIGALGTIQRFNGTLDDLMLFGRSLSESEILNLYNNENNSARKAESIPKGDFKEETSKIIQEVRIDDIYGFKIYPNPVDEELHIQMNSREEVQVNILVYDMMGRQYINQSTVPENGEIILDLVKAKLATGTYLLILDQGKSRIKQFKFIKK
jgi:hypothetical protein